MAELPRTHPLQARSAAFERLPGTVGITAEPFVAMVDVRLGTADPEVAARREAATRLGVDLPAVPNSWVPAGGGRAVWLGPGEWLLTSTTEAPEELEARVRAAVLPLGGAAADVSAQRIGLRLTGPRARGVLAKGCSIDLHPRVFGQGSSVQTTLAQAGVVLLALSAAGDDYLMFVRSSFAGYLADWLLDAALEFTVPGSTGTQD
jgi:sarcosine oxidase subunit gamma